MEGRQGGGCRCTHHLTHHDMHRGAATGCKRMQRRTWLWLLSGAATPEPIKKQESGAYRGACSSSASSGPRRASSSAWEKVLRSMHTAVTAAAHLPAAAA